MSRSLPSQRPTKHTAPQAGFGDAAEAMRALAALLDGAGQADGVDVGELLATEAQRFFRVPTAVLLSAEGPDAPLEVTGMFPRREHSLALPGLEKLPPLAELSRSGAPYLWTGGEAASRLCLALGLPTQAGALLLELPPSESVRQVLVLLDQPRPSEDELGVARAFASAAGAGLAQLRLARETSARTARQAALARAAKTLNQTLDLNRVLVSICEEATSILQAGGAAVYVGDAEHGLRAKAVYGLPFDAIGSRLRAGEGLAGKVVERDEAMLTNDYQGMAGRPELSFLSDVRSGLSVPMRWDGELRGALTVVYRRPFVVTPEHLSLLAAFADLAAAACSNATAHAGLARAARTDALTGCLNRAAFQRTLGRELERSARTGNSLSLALVDLDDFKQVNERHGHLAGDEVLRRVGQALRQAVRPYDHVARYGGDEFAILALDAGEDDARQVASRAVQQLAGALSDLDPGARTGATAGVAEWRAGERAERLIERADGALLYGKHQGVRGEVLGASALPLFGSGTGGELDAELQAALSEPK
ncbi:MAG: diguanylate cyclase domain-containing protein [Thermoleophilaceae bacterium]